MGNAFLGSSYTLLLAMGGTVSGGGCAVSKGISQVVGGKAPWVTLAVTQRKTGIKKTVKHSDTLLDLLLTPHSKEIHKPFSPLGVRKPCVAKALA